VGRGSGLVDRGRSVGRWVCRWSASVSGVGRGLFGRSVVSVGVGVGSVGGRRRVSRSQARSNSTIQPSVRVCMCACRLGDDLFITTVVMFSKNIDLLLRGDIRKRETRSVGGRWSASVSGDPVGGSGVGVG
jgi:hypothetical protein